VFLGNEVIQYLDGIFVMTADLIDSGEFILRSLLVAVDNELRH
jgi:hypothetical protein